MVNKEFDDHQAMLHGRILLLHHHKILVWDKVALGQIECLIPNESHTLKQLSHVDTHV